MIIKKLQVLMTVFIALAVLLPSDVAAQGIDAKKSMNADFEKGQKSYNNKAYKAAFSYFCNPISFFF